MLSIASQFHRNRKQMCGDAAESAITCRDIWNRLNELYDLKALDAEVSLCAIGSQSNGS